MNMDTEELFQNPVSKAQVAQVLQLITTLPHKREQPIVGDLPGKFDFWFDGGAVRHVTGWSEYELADGSRVEGFVVPGLSLVIQFSNGARVRVQQI
jgi:hypothetical protein